MKGKSLSPAQLFETPWTAAYQASPSMGFSRQEYWSGVPLPSPIYRLHKSNWMWLHHEPKRQGFAGTSSRYKVMGRLPKAICRFNASLFVDMFSIFLDGYLGIELLVYFLVFEKLPNCFPK